MRARDAIAIAGIGRFTRVSERQTSGSNQEILMRGDGMAPSFRTGEKVTYDPSVAFSSLTVGSVIVSEETAGTFRVARCERLTPAGEWVVKMDGKRIVEGETVRADKYRGKVI